MRMNLNDVYTFYNEARLMVFEVVGFETYTSPTNGLERIDIQCNEVSNNNDLVFQRFSTMYNESKFLCKFKDLKKKYPEYLV